MEQVRSLLTKLVHTIKVSPTLSTSQCYIAPMVETTPVAHGTAHKYAVMNTYVTTTFFLLVTCKVVERILYSLKCFRKHHRNILTYMQRQGDSSAKQYHLSTRSISPNLTKLFHMCWTSGAAVKVRAPLSS